MIRALRRWRSRNAPAGHRLLEAYADLHPDAYFIEIGANDGEQHDHLRPFILSRRWRGIMVEPVPYVFDRLRRNYGGVDSVVLENVAIADHDGSVPFHYLRDATAEERAGLPDWYDGIGSLSRDFIVSHARHIPDVESRIVSTELPTLTYESLCRRHGVERVDVLVVDVEGHDWEIIRGIDLRARPPALLVYEHYHLSPADRAAARAHVSGAGYRVLEEGFDTFCLHGSTDRALHEVLDGLQPTVPPLARYEEHE